MQYISGKYLYFLYYISELLNYLCPHPWLIIAPIARLKHIAATVEPLTFCFFHSVYQTTLPLQPPAT